MSDERGLPSVFIHAASDCEDAPPPVSTFTSQVVSMKSPGASSPSFPFTFGIDWPYPQSRVFSSSHFDFLPNSDDIAFHEPFADLMDDYPLDRQAQFEMYENAQYNQIHPIA